MSRAFVFRSVTLLCVLGAAVGTVPLARSPLLAPAAAAAAPRALPFHFERNAGQAPGEVEFLARGAGHTLFLARDAAVLALSQPNSRGDAPPSETLRMRLVGARTVTPAGGDELPGRVHYFLGDDPEQWRRNVPTFGKVTYAQVYPGIDLVYHGTPTAGAGAFEYDFIVASGSDPAAIAVEMEGASRLRLEESGDAVICTAAGELRQRRPVAYQWISGRQVSVDCRFLLSRGEPGPEGARSILRFAVGAYDRTKPLVIDPVIVYSTLLGGTGQDTAFRAAVDASGALYVSGWTASIDFPLAAPFQGANAGLLDAFVAKLDPTGRTLEYATYVGGSANDFGGPMDFGSDGSLYLALDTRSSDFPIWANAADPTYAGNSDAAVVRLSPSGADLLYSTFFGGSGFEGVYGMEVGANGEATVTGETESADLLTTSGAFQTSFGGEGDIFAFRVNAPGTAVVWSTYVGGSGYEFVRRLAVDAAGSICITGTTYSPNLPTTAGALRETWDGVGDAYVVKLSDDGSQLLLCTYLGGSSFDYGQDIALDANGSIYVSGSTESLDLPGTATAFQRGHGGGTEDAFVAKLNPGGDSLAWASYLGGSQNESLFALALDRTGNVYGTGRTSSPDFFTTFDAFQAAYGGGASDAILIRLSADGSVLRYSTFLGGPGEEAGTPVLVDAAGRVYVTGSSSLPGFPTTAGAFQTAHLGGSDAFALTLDATPAAPEGMFVSGSGNSVALVRPRGPLPVDALRIERRIGNGQFSLLATIASDALPFLDTVPLETPIIYRVSALDAGFSSAPTVLRITTLREPSSFRLVRRTETSLEFAWFDNSKAETDYQFERRSGSGPWELLALLSAGTTSYTDRGLRPFQTFRYRLKAISRVAASLYTPVVKATTDTKVGGTLSVDDTLPFGPVPIRTKETRRLALTNTSQTERLRVDVSGVGSPFGVPSGLQVFLDPGETEEMTISFRPTQKKRYAEDLQLVSTDPRRKRMKILLTGRGI
jgi:hypothetical protein